MACPETTKYDVFLSFRGEDTRNKFTSHLYSALAQKNIQVFVDDETLEKRGDGTSVQLLRAIEESKVSVVVFSENYASSSWCLEELVHILECKEERGQKVVPVFYYVDPYVVARQEGIFANSFAKHSRVFKDNLGKVEKWKNALTEIVRLSGWVLKQWPAESKVVEEVVEHISKILDLKFLSASAGKDLVGMASRLRKLESCLNIGLNDVRIIGIWGLGGIGKTTLANVVFDKFRDQFESSCFISHVGEEFTKHGMLGLQAQLDEKLLKTKTATQVIDVEHGEHGFQLHPYQGTDINSSLLRYELSSKKVLFVLDDVSALGQIEALIGKAGERNPWFAPGSRIIITTRNRQLLSSSGVDYIFEVENLTDDDALQLFSLKALKENHPGDDYIELAKKISKYAGGLPLALKVLGSNFYARGKLEWLNVLSQLDETSKDTQLHSMMRINYDALCWNEKQIFLDIACFFIGEDESRINMLLDSVDVSLANGIHVLAQKSLISIEEGRIWMHDLLQDLAQKIVYQESLKEPGKRSRLWLYEDACHVLQKNKGTRHVEGLFLCSPGEEEKHVCLNQDPFFMMKNLRFLKICNVKVSGCLKYDIPRNLRLLEWHMFPLRSMPSSFEPNMLVELSMPRSRIELLWGKARMLEKLRLLNLSNCQYLKKTPDFSMMPNLEKLILEGCKRLSEVHPSLGVLERLVLLNMKGCECLERLPQNIKLRSLKTFNLSGCSTLKSFPEIVDNMENFSELHLEGTNILELPRSIKRLSGLASFDLKNRQNFYGSITVPDNWTSLKVLDLSGCSNIDRLSENLGSLEQLEQFFVNGTIIRKVPSSILLLNKLKVLSFRGCKGLQLPSSFSGLCSLISLDLSQCSLPQGAIPNDIDSLSSLEYLDLSENNFSTIPERIFQLSNLRELRLFKCSNLQSLPKLSLSVQYVVAYDCPMLRRDSSADLTIKSWNEVFQIIDCQKSLSSSEDWRMHARVPLYGDALFPKFIEELIWDKRQFEICFPYARIPNWCCNWSVGSSITTSTKDNKYTRKGFALFLVISIKELENFDQDREFRKISCHFQTSEGPIENPLFFQNFQHLGVGSFGIFCYVPQERLNMASRIIGASFSIGGSNLELKMSGVHPVFEQEVKSFSVQLSQTANQHRDVVSHFSRHCEELIEGATKLVAFHDGRKIGYDPLERQTTTKETTLEAEQECSTWFMRSSVKQCFITDLTIQRTSDLWSLLIRLFQGNYARTCTFHFVVPLTLVSPFFFHHCLGNVAVCYVPPSLHNDEKWFGLELYVLFTRRPAGSSKGPSVVVDLYGHGISTVPILTYPIMENDLFGSLFVVYHVPRKCFPEQLNQCKGISAFFRPITSDVEIQRCGAHLLYEEDGESLVEAIIECTLRIPDVVDSLHLQAERNIKAAEEFLQRVDIGDHDASKQEMPHFGLYSFYERELIESLQKLLGSSEQLAQEVSTTLRKYRSFLQGKHDYKEFDPILLHSENHIVENLEPMEEISGEGSLRNLIYDFNHIHIMAETLLFSGDRGKWKRNLQFLLTEFFKDSAVVTLSLKGHMISMSKHFDPYSTYNMCFPRKEILPWFEHQNNASMVEIKLPTNLCDDENWRGLVICASLDAHEHPSTSEISFILLCHLTMNGCCLNPVSVFSVTKEEFKWSYIRGFIWITYLPRVMLEELKGQTNVEARIYSGCPYLTVRKCGIRLLYQQDAEDFKQALIHCWTSFFDNLGPVSLFVADEREKATSC